MDSLSSDSFTGFITQIIGIKLMEKASPLFRQEVIDNRINRSLGTTRINVPMNYHIAGFGALLIVILLILFVFFAQFSEKTYIQGYLDSKKGIVTIESEFQGIVKTVAVEEGMYIHKGEVLFIIAKPNQDHTHQQINMLNQRISNLTQEYHLNKKHHQALKQLFNKKFIALSALTDSETTLLEIKNKLESAKLDLMNFKDNQYHQITAPIDGIITNIFYHKGHSIQPAKPIVQIIPKEAELVARLYIPASEIGFIKLNQTIRINYDAYPSRRFGFYQATIQEINQTILTDEKEDKPIHVGVPYYKIMAKLKEPYVNVYGKKTALNHGMTLHAVVYGEKKKIWQWVLDPLYSFRNEWV